MIYTDEMRTRMAEDVKGKVVKSLEWDKEDGYWVMEFTDGTELCFRMMAELV